MADNPSDTTDESSAAETTASSTYKVLGELADAGGIGVLGRNTAGSGATYGVKGAVDSPDGYGVYTPDDAKVDGTLVVPALGTLTQDDLVLLVNDLVALRIEPGDGDYGPNAILGHASNAVGDGARAASIGGGGYEATSDYGNKVYDDFGTVGGGINNQAGDGDGDGTSAMNATVAGGNNNTASGSQSAVGGGAYNEATGYASAVAGGSSNESRESYGAIGGGQQNRVYDSFGTVAGGYNNEAGTDDGDAANQEYATVGGGYRNDAEALYSTVAGGRSNDARAENASVGGGYGNSAVAKDTRVGGGFSNYALGEGSTVGGGVSNSAEAMYATIAGGGPSDPASPTSTNNVVYDDYGTVAGGGGNVAGYNNSSLNTTYATVGGGKDNHAADTFATIPGGKNNTAQEHAFAAGHNADANYPGSFVWADNHTSEFSAWGYNTWNARCRGGARFVTSIDGSGIPDAGVTLSSGSGSWSSLSASASKTNVRPVDPETVLDEVADLSINTWEYRSEDGVDHMGPMAEDFHEAFGLGTDEEHITTVDADGVALAAIQGLATKLDEKDDHIDTMEADLERRDERVDALEAELESKDDRIDALEARNESLSERLSTLEATVGSAAAPAAD